VPIGDPGGRSGHSLSYDSARGVAVLFGGLASAQLTSRASSETWEFDGRRWRFRTLEGPSGRFGAAMAYDADRHITVLFGGLVTDQPSPTLLVASAETWEWDGVSWALRPGAGPSARSNAAMAYDAARHTMLLFGGATAGGANLRDLWTWNGTTWASVPQSGTWPLGGATPSMAYDAQQGAVVLTSGGNSTATWNGSEWTTLTGAISSQARLAFDPSRGTVVAIAPAAAGTMATSELRGGTWQSLNLPLAGTSAALVYHQAAGHLITFEVPSLQADRSVITGHDLVDGAWTARRSRATPPGAFDPAMAFDSERGVSVLFGGGATEPAATDETWELRGETWSRRAVGGPPARNEAGMAYDPVRRVCILKGGSTNDPDTWEWDGQSWTRRIAGGPTEGSASIGFDPGRNEALMVGANIPATYDGSTWTAISGQSLMEGAIAFDPVRGGLLIAGSTGGPGTWFFNGQTITTLIAAQETATWRPGMAYDPARGGLVLFGGWNTLAMGQTYTFAPFTYFLGSSAQNWTILPNRGPIGRKYLRMVYDSLAQRVVLYGGSDHITVFRETWKLAQGPTAIAAEPEDTAASPGSTVTLSCVASGGGWLDYQWRKDGVALEDSGHLDGTHTDTLTINGLASADVGRYDCAVEGPCRSATTRAAQLTDCYANCDVSTGTPALNVADFICFQQRFAAGHPYANCDGSTAAPVLTIADFVCFQQRFAAGCP
jgi:hypothetical protein